jgi:hypothetical protein
MRLESALVHPTKGPGAVYHDVRGSFSELLRYALSGEPALAALGPIYSEDPAASLLAPFSRATRESGWHDWGEETMVPPHVLEAARQLRTSAAFAPFRDGQDERRVSDIDDWTRAGLVLEIATRSGIHVTGRGKVHVPWNLRGTVTGRFGCEPVRGPGWSFNPLSLGPDDRWRVRPSDAVRTVAAIDFRAMDVVSMTALIPSLADVVGDYPDPYTMIAEETGTSLARDMVKLNFLTWAYGGQVDRDVSEMFRSSFPGVVAIAFGMEHGQFPRLVQSTSALAFRAALSRALPLLTTPWIIPMFTVHDELTLDCSEWGLDRIKEVTQALEQGASERIGRPYRVSVRTGYTYEEAKADR